MFGILKKLGEIGSHDVIGNDLGRLNTVKKGLGTQAAQYVRTGEGGEVLATLSNTTVSREIVATHCFGMKLEETWMKRCRFLLDCTPYDTALMARYAEVLGAICSHTPAGPETVDIPLRVFFENAFTGARAESVRWPPEPRDAKVTGLTPDAAIAIGAELDTDAASVLATLLWQNDNWGEPSAGIYRTLVDFGGFLAANPDLVIQSDQHLDAPSRTVLCDELHKAHLADREPFLSLLLGYAGASAKIVRESVLNILMALPAETVETPAIAMLAKGNVAARQAMAGLLGKLGTDSAIAALAAHLEKEKTARIRAGIENTLATQSSRTVHSADGDQQQGTAQSYIAIDGSQVIIPPRRDLPDDPQMLVGPQWREKIEDAIKSYNAKAEQTNAEITRSSSRWRLKPVVKSPRRLADAAVELLNTGKLSDTAKIDQDPYHFLGYHASDIFKQALDAIPLRRQLQAYLYSGSQDTFYLRNFINKGSTAPIVAWLGSDEGDMRALEHALIESRVKAYRGSSLHAKGKVHDKGDLIYELLPDHSWSAPAIDRLSDASLWPLIAENFALIDQPLGLAPTSGPEMGREVTVKALGRLPKIPQRYFGPLLDIATGESKAGRAEARALLGDAPLVDDRLIALLDDGRQAIRAGAAQWLSARGAKNAIKPLKARLKKEKSELARAALLTALDSLGEGLSSFVGPSALIAETEAGLKKAKLDKLDWLDLEYLPKLAWANGKTAPPDVIRWWLFVANKLKQPGGNALFEIYLDQLQPDSAATLSTWVFDSWIAYDTKQPGEDEAVAHAKANVKARYAQLSRWWKDLTEDATFLLLKREITSQYPNSGSAFKGLLGLATRVPAAHAADRVRHYLRNHGKRTSQATSLLELLAAKADAVSLQVVIAAATRLKQKGVQAKAGEMIATVADARGWSLQELADRTVPTAGMDDEGILDLPCGPDEKPYQARLGDDLHLLLVNPDGKIVKALPGGDDENTKESKKQLSASRKEIKQVIKAQSERLYEALCAERKWPVNDWLRDFNDHPVMRRLIERVVWIGLDNQGNTQTAFRPTTDGDFTDADDGPVDPQGFAAVRLAHGALLPPAEVATWKTHLHDYEVKPLFSQFKRPLLHLTDDLKKADHIADRQGWMTDAFTIRGVASKLGYDRGETLDGGFFCDYVKPFKSADLVAVIEFTGNALPEENVRAGLRTVLFIRGDTGYNAQKVPLEKVPPVLLSECWNDYHQMAAKAHFDPDWEKKTLW